MPFTRACRDSLVLIIILILYLSAGTGAGAGVFGNLGVAIVAAKAQFDCAGRRTSRHFFGARGFTLLLIALRLKTFAQ